MSGERPVLFVVAEAGAADYFAPLWRAWAAVGAGDWQVAAGPRARAAVAGSTAHAISAPESGEGLAEILGDWRPRLVVMSATGAPLERAGLALARAAGVPAYQAVDTWYGYRRRLTHGGEALWPDRLLVIDDDAAAAARGEGVPAERLLVTGHPGWAEAATLPPADPRAVAFLEQPVAANYGERLGYTELSSWALLQEAARRRPDLVGETRYCRHPDCAATPPPGAGDVAEDSRAALAACGTVTGMFSSLMTEAVLGGRRVVSLQPGAAGDDLCALSARGLIPRAATAEDLIAALERPATASVGRLAENLRGSRERLEAAIQEALAAPLPRAAGPAERRPSDRIGGVSR